jgi:hypothetical protein
MKENKIIIKDKRTVLSTLWIFILFNMVYADILGMIRPGYVEFLSEMGNKLSASTVLFFAVFMEVVIVMVLLSRILQRKANKWAHYFAVPFSILWIIVPALMPSLGHSTPLSYVFFAIVEVATLLWILCIVMRWKDDEESCLVS